MGGEDLSAGGGLVHGSTDPLPLQRRAHVDAAIASAHQRTQAYAPQQGSQRTPFAISCCIMLNDRPLPADECHTGQADNNCCHSSPLRSLHQLMPLVRSRLNFPPRCPRVFRNDGFSHASHTSNTRSPHRLTPKERSVIRRRQLLPVSPPSSVATIQVPAFGGDMTAARARPPQSD